MFLQNLFILTGERQCPREQAFPSDGECMFYVLIHKYGLGLSQVTNV